MARAGRANDIGRTKNMILIGQEITLGWNGAKYFDSMLSSSTVRVEAVGIDWIVIRDAEGRAWASGFEKGTDILKTLRG